MEVKFEPSICKETEEKDGKKTPPSYSGTITMKAPSFDERLELQEIYNASDAEDDGAEDEVDESTLSAKQKKLIETKKTARGMQRLRRLAKFVPKFIVAVDLVRLEDSQKIATWDDLSVETEASGAVMDCAVRLIGKWKVGNVSTSSS